MGTNKLIIVKRIGLDTFRRLRDKFADDYDVKVVLDRRSEEPSVTIPRERRHLRKSSERDYVVVHTPGQRFEFPNSDVGRIAKDDPSQVIDNGFESWWGK